jgi:hypothetical protein
MKLIIQGRMTDANQFIAAVAVNRYAGGSIKKRETEKVAWLCKEQKLVSTKNPVDLIFNWYCKNKKKDKDNIAFAKKFIIDGLQMAGVIQNDTWALINGFTDKFYLDENERIEVEII